MDIFDMREEDVEIAIKVVVVGNGAVGKSSMIQRYCKGIFTNDYKKTIGVDFLERQIQVNCEDVRLMLWDTAGQEEFDAITKAYYRGAQACVLVFSTVDRESFLAIESWKRKVENECGRVPTVLVQNKVDLIDDAVISREEAEALAKKLHLRFYRTSVKEDLNVKEVFEHIAERYMDMLNEVPEEPIERQLPNRDGGSYIGKRDSNNLSSHRVHSAASNGTISLQPIKKQGKKRVFKGCNIL